MIATIMMGNDNEKMDDDGRVTGSRRSGSFVLVLVVVAVMVFFG